MRCSPLWLVATLLIAGCDQPVEPNVQATAGSPAFAQDAAEQTFVFRFDESVTFFDSCFGEEILFEAHRQVVTYFKGDVTAGHSRFVVIDLGSTVTGLTTGNVWTLHGAHVEGGNGDFTAAETPGEYTVVTNSIFTSRDSDIRQRFYDRYHITINPDQRVTVERIKFTGFCG